MSVTLSNDKKALLFKMMGEKAMYEVGVEFGLDKHYKDSRAVKNAVYRIYNEVRMNPEEYLLTADQVEKVVSIVSKRAITPAVNVTEREKVDAAKDFNNVVINTRDKAMGLLNRKLDLIGKSNKALKEVDLGKLVIAAGTLFDKGQIISGHATEHIAVLGKIDKDITPEEAMQKIIQMREMNQLDKDRSSKRK